MLVAATSTRERSFVVASRARLVVGGVVAGLALWWLRPPAPMVERETATARWSGTIVGDVRRDAGGATFPFALADGRCVRGRVTAAAGITAGARLVVRGRLVPFDDARNPGEPSERALARDDGVAGELLVSRVLERAPPDDHDLRAWPARVRGRLGTLLRARVREPEASVVAGALWGERAALPAALRDDFRATGTVHVLVTAGLHLGIVAALALGLASALAVPRAAGAGATALVVVVYAILSGWHLPSQRACAMVLVALLARALGARPRPGDALLVAAVAVLAWDPRAFASVSFLLSFSCVSAIACFAGPAAEQLRRLRVPMPLREALALTVATQLGVWPLSAAVFGTLAPYAVVANAIVVPAVGLALPLGLATLALAPVAPLAELGARWATWVVAAIVGVVHAVAALPGARATIAPPPAWSVALYDALALVAAAALRRARPAVAVVLLSTGAGAVAYAARHVPPRALTITMLDVGQGDGIVVESPHGRVVLFDAGGRLERGPRVEGASPAERAGERVVLGYLRRRGIAHVDLLVITHAHGDHVGGCAPIVTALHVDAILEPGVAYGGTAYRDCIAAARARGVPVRVARRGDRWQSGDGLTIDVLAPEEPLLADTGDDVNENSVVAMMRYRADGRDARALFTGDAGGATEARLLAHGDDLRAEVLKVGHHGSAHSSTPAFVAAVAPVLALISVGRHNAFGHPAPATIATLAAARALPARTDRCGAIVITLAPRTAASQLCPPLWAR